MCDLDEFEEQAADFEFDDCDEALDGQSSTLLPKTSSDIFKKTARVGPGYGSVHSAGPGNKFSFSTSSRGMTPT